MKTKALKFANSLVAMALTSTLVLSFISCGGDDSIDDILSKETTPIDFEFSGFSYYYGSANFLFDYAGNSLVGSDTISKSSCTLNLRQGKHKLIWINGLWPTSSWMTDIDGENRYGIYFDPKTKTITNNDLLGNTGNVIVYNEKDLEVAPYLLPVQKVEYKHITCELNIEVTDDARWLTWIPSQPGPKGRIIGVPSIKSVSLDNNKYTLNDVKLPGDSISRYEGNYPYRFFMLCPTDGLDNIQPIAEIIDNNGNLIPTTSIPKFSLRRGYKTTVRGPLLSGSSSDWTVTMEPYKDF